MVLGLSVPFSKGLSEPVEESLDPLLVVALWGRAVDAPRLPEWMIFAVDLSSDDEPDGVLAAAPYSVSPCAEAGVDAEKDRCVGGRDVESDLSATLSFAAPPADLADLLTDRGEGLDKALGRDINIFASHGRPPFTISL